MSRTEDMCFEPLENFKWFKEDAEGQKILIANYLPGFEYTCTTQAKHDALAEQMVVWEEDGKIRVYPRSGSPRVVRVTGTAEVGDA